MTFPHSISHQELCLTKQLLLHVFRVDLKDLDNESLHRHWHLGFRDITRELKTWEYKVTFTLIIFRHFLLREQMVHSAHDQLIKSQEEFLAGKLGPLIVELSFRLKPDLL